MKDITDRKEYHKSWYKKNRDRVLAGQKEYYEKNKERKKKYQAENADRIKARKSAYVKNNSQKFKDYYKQYYENPVNKERKRSLAKARSRDIRKRVKDAYANDPVFRIKTLLRNRLARALRLKNQRKLFSHMDFIGCTPAALIRHIEEQFTDGMSWSRRGEIHIDHIKPLSSFDLTDEIQCMQACHYTNLRPLWAKDNLTRTY